MITNGWAGRRAVINLTSRETSVEEIPHSHLREWIGGRALNVIEIRKRTVPGLDAFNTDSPLCFAAGPLAGTLAPCSASLHVAARSPVAYPGTIAMAEINGAAGPRMKLAGFDQIIVLGVSERPVYIVAQGGRVEFRDASECWGLDPAATQAAIRQELGDDASVVSIGLAGENEVRFASMLADCAWPGDGCGFGAVMGARKLKAIVFAGSGPMRTCHGNLLREKGKDARRSFAKAAGVRALSESGTLFPLDWLAGSWALSTRNFTACTPDALARLGTAEYSARFLGARTGCFSCPIHCGRFTAGEELSARGVHFGGLHFEAAASIGLKLGLSRWSDVLRVCHACIRFGLDPSAFASLVAWLTEGYERGLLDGRRTGRVLEFGDVEAAVALAETAARREGHGRFFGEGACREARRSAEGAEQLLFHVAGFDWPALDPRIFKGLALSFPTAPHDAGPFASLACPMLPGYPGFSPGLADLAGRPGTWDMSFAASFGGKAALLAHSRLLSCAAQMCGTCRLPVTAAFALTAKDLAELLYAVTGEEFGPAQVISKAARVLGLEWEMMLEDGLGLDVLKPPARFFAEPVREGQFKGEVLKEKEFAAARGEYIDAIGKARLRGDAASS